MNKLPHEQRGEARIKKAERSQVEMVTLSLEDRLDKGHRVRMVWEYVMSLDLSELYGEIQARKGVVGRDAVDPRILFSLWLFSTIEGCTSARRLEVLTQRDIAYMWLCGGVGVNYHLLSDFRVKHGGILERILKDSIAVLLHQNLIKLETVAQDGMRVRASAGGGSFRREASLEECLEKAERHMADLAKEDSAGEEKRSKAAQERAAREKTERIKKALEEIKIIKEKRESTKKKRDDTREIRASTTDPEARRMKMGDGGFRPALNVQFCTDGDSRLIVGVDVVNQGSDQGLMEPMHQQIVSNYKKSPKKYLVDGGFTTVNDINELTNSGTIVFGALKNVEDQLDAGKNPYAKKPKDSQAMADFRARMGTKDAQEIYSKRASIAEFSNAECRNRGLSQFRVRGLIKAKAQVFWHVLAHNFNRFINLDYLKIFTRTNVPLTC